MRKLTLIFLFLLLLMPMTLAVKPTIITGNFPLGYTLKTPLFETLKVNQSYNFYVHVYNTSSGEAIINNIGCYMHLYNTSGNHLAIVTDYTISSSYDYSFYVDGQNFTNPNIYNAVLWCNNTNKGGFLEMELPVTYSGYQGETNVAVKTGATTLVFVIVMFAIMFLFIKIGNSIENRDWITFALKMLFYCFAIGMTFIPLAFVNTMLEYAKDTIPDQFTSSGLGSNALDIWNTAFGTLRIAVITIAIFALIYLIYIIYLSLMNTANDSHKGFKGEL